MHPQAAQLIDALGLRPHPEGGHYRELHRSSAQVQPLDGRPPRSALTTIYFLLGDGDVSRWHRVASDEVWHFLDGAPLHIFVADSDFKAVRQHQLGSIRDGLVPEFIVAAHDWQAARSTGAWTLVACVVGPGFEFADFAMLRHNDDDSERVRHNHPDVASLI